MLVSTQANGPLPPAPAELELLTTLLAVAPPAPLLAVAPPAPLLAAAPPAPLLVVALPPSPSSSSFFFLGSSPQAQTSVAASGSTIIQACFISVISPDRRSCAPGWRHPRCEKYTTLVRITTEMQGCAADVFAIVQLGLDGALTCCCLNVVQPAGARMLQRRLRMCAAVLLLVPVVLSACDEDCARCRTCLNPRGAGGGGGDTVPSHC